MSHYPLLREASSRSLGYGFLRTPERPLLQWTPSITQVDPVHYAGQPCLQAICLSRPSPPDHPHRMTRRPVTRMPRVTTLPPNVTCRRVTHPILHTATFHTGNSTDTRLTQIRSSHRPSRRSQARPWHPHRTKQ